MSTKAVLKRSGFTLIELLVVIAIIGLLVSILAPSLSEARYQAKVGKCQAGLHVVGVAIQGYMTSYGLDKPWPFNNGTRDGCHEGNYRQAFSGVSREGNGPFNPAQALMPGLMWDHRRLVSKNPLAWKRRTPNFLESAEPLFCPADDLYTLEDHFNVWGKTQPGISEGYWSTYPYLYPHVLTEDDPFHVTVGWPRNASRLAHINNITRNVGKVGRFSKDLVMHDRFDMVRVHFNSLQLNGVVEVVAQTKNEMEIYLDGE